MRKLKITLDNGKSAIFEIDESLSQEEAIAKIESMVPQGAVLTSIDQVGGEDSTGPKEVPKQAKELRREALEPNREEYQKMSLGEKANYYASQFGINPTEAQEEIRRNPYSAEYRLFETDQSVLGGAGRALADLATPQRQAFSDPSKVSGQTGSMLRDIATAPEMLPTMLTGFGAGTALQGAKFLPRVLGTALPTMGVDLGMQEASGKDVTGGDVALAGLGSFGGELFGEAVKPVGKYIADKGGKMLQTILKPSKKLLKQDFNADVIYEKGLQGTTVKKTLDNVEKRIADVGEQYDEILKKNQDVEIDLFQAYSDAIDEIGGEVSKGKFAEIGDGIEQGAEKWSKALERLVDDSGKIKITEAVRNFRKSLGNASKFGKQTGDPSLTGQATFARFFREKVNKQIADAVPDVRVLDKELSELKPINEAVEDAFLNTGKNKGISLTDGLAVVAGVGAGGSHGLVPAIAGGVTLGALNKFGRSSAGANTMRGLGNIIQNNIGSAPLGVQLGKIADPRTFYGFDKVEEQQ